MVRKNAETLEMTLTGMKDAVVFFTATENKVIDRLAKVVAESDDRSGRPWVIGDLVNELEPAGKAGANNGSYARLDEIAKRVKAERRYLLDTRIVATAWPRARRAGGVSFGVFRALSSSEDRFQILATLIEKHGAENVTANLARELAGRQTDLAPATRPEMLDKAFKLVTKACDMPGRITKGEEAIIGQIRLALDILVGDADDAELAQILDGR
jgi:hypothetical protein